MVTEDTHGSGCPTFITTKQGHIISVMRKQWESRFPRGMPADYVALSCDVSIIFRCL